MDTIHKTYPIHLKMEYYSLFFNSCVRFLIFLCLYIDVIEYIFTLLDVKKKSAKDLAMKNNELFKKDYFITDTIYESQRTKVFSAIRIKDNLPVIIKELDVKYPSEKDLKVFSNGFNIVHALNNDKLIQMYESKFSFNQAAYVMEHMRGISLDRIILNHSLSIEEFLELALGIVDNLKAIHECQLIHQGITPSNIIWNSDTGQVKIIDFKMATELIGNKKNFQLPDYD